jgi:hypothetical protein
MALFLGPGAVRSLAVLLLLGLAAVAVSVFAAQLQREGSRLLTVIRAGAEMTGQTVVRLAMLLLVTLEVLAISSTSTSCWAPSRRASCSGGCSRRGM